MTGQEPAETLALQALAWILADPERAGQFLAATGADASALTRMVAEPLFLGAVLDFLLTDERALLDFAADAGIAPDLPMRARAALPGGDVPHWT